MTRLFQTLALFRKREFFEIQGSAKRALKSSQEALQHRYFNKDFENQCFFVVFSIFSFLRKNVKHNTIWGAGPVRIAHGRPPILILQ